MKKIEIKKTPPVVGRQIRYSKYESKTHAYYSKFGWGNYVTREEAISIEIENDAVSKSHTHDNLIKLENIMNQSCQECGTVFDYYSDVQVQLVCLMKQGKWLWKTLII